MPEVQRGMAPTSLVRLPPTTTTSVVDGIAPEALADQGNPPNESDLLLN